MHTKGGYYVNTPPVCGENYLEIEWKSFAVCSESHSLPQNTPATDNTSSRSRACRLHILGFYRCYTTAIWSPLATVQAMVPRLLIPPGTRNKNASINSQPTAKPCTYVLVLYEKNTDVQRHLSCEIDFFRRILIIFAGCV